jgi:WD40 repeat protein
MDSLRPRYPMIVQSKSGYIYRTVLTTFYGHLKTVGWAIFSPDSTLCASYRDDNDVRIWNVRNGHSVSTFVEHRDYVYCMDFSTDGSQLVSLLRSSLLQDVATGDSLHATIVPSDLRLTCISCEDDGTSIILKDIDGNIQTRKSSPAPKS